MKALVLHLEALVRCPWCSSTRSRWDGRWRECQACLCSWRVQAVES